MLHAIIMAGGAGTRFWPESRTARPKQLLDLAGGRTMIQSTVDRLGSLVSTDRVLIVTNQSLVRAIAEQLPDLPASAILGEPCKHDTAPCIGLAALYVMRHDADATMAVMPSDHVIQPDEVFQAALRHAAQLVDEQPQRIVTFGIPPSYPAESFGYIERGETLGSHRTSGSPAVFHVRQFREKPNADTARKYVAQGTFYWNSGIFVWKARTILDALKQHQPKMYGHLEKIAASLGTPDYPEVLVREFSAIQPISIDFAVMEHAKEVLVVEAPYAWDDVGSWQALSRLQAGDEHGNTIAAPRYLGLNTKGTIVRSHDDHLIVTLGIQDCIIVHTPDATLVANKHDEEAIRQLVKLIEQKGWTEYL